MDRNDFLKMCQIFNVAILHELNANCRIDVPLDLVEKLTTE